MDNWKPVGRLSCTVRGQSGHSQHLVKLLALAQSQSLCINSEPVSEILECEDDLGCGTTVGACYRLICDSEGMIVRSINNKEPHRWANKHLYTSILPKEAWLREHRNIHQATGESLTIMSEILQAFRKGSTKLLIKPSCDLNRAKGTVCCHHSI